MPRLPGNDAAGCHLLSTVRDCGTALAALWLMTAASLCAGAEQPNPVDLVKLTGGLVVQIGSRDTETAIALSHTGRYLVHLLVSPADVAQTQTRCRKEGCYGLVSVEALPGSARLPYADNLVNLIVVDAGAVPPEELFRALAPQGSVVVRGSQATDKASFARAGFTLPGSGTTPLVARKPWPAAMDSWSHPRHGGDGNAVASDTSVEPPNTIRWIAGAHSEVEGLVTAGGRNFYGGILARDSFNGLRLWHRDLRSGKANAAVFTLPRIIHNRARPIVAASVVLVSEKNRLVAVGATDGELVRTYSEIANPIETTHIDGRIVACSETTVNAYRVEAAEPLWTHAASGPRNLAVDAQTVSFIQGRAPRGEKVMATVLEAVSGAVRWECAGFPWLEKVKRTVLHGDLLVYEVSSFNDHDADNGIHVVSANTGKLLWEKEFPPGMNHNRQARAMFVGNDLWIQHGGKINSMDKENVKRLPIEISALDPRTGEVRLTHPAGLAHCFPPVATSRYVLSGVMDLVDLTTGKMTVNPITKANCSRENGWVPANGLIYTTPKHCTCWPILRGYTALAADPGGTAGKEPDLIPQRGPAVAEPDAPSPASSDWPQYRHDRWRSAGTDEPGPTHLGTVWSTSLIRPGTHPSGPIVCDWGENEFVKGPLTPPTVAYGHVYVGRPNAHEVVALDAATGSVSWRFTADGRVDTPPTLHRGLCLFGSRGGSVYALRADNGQLVWQLRAGPVDRRIVAYGQLESLWPVPGSVLVAGDTAYFAAGRQPLSDGGLLVFAVDPLTGRKRWVHRIDSIPQKGFYENSGLDFDSFDILHQEGDGIALSRWIISDDGRTCKVDKWSGFARLDPGGGAVWVPRGSWNYGPRHQHRFGGEARRRPLSAFRAKTVLTSVNGTTKIFRRDFDLENGEEFNGRWITGWEAAQKAREGGAPYRTSRLAEKAAWECDHFLPKSGTPPKPPRRGAQLYNNLHGMALAGDGRMFVVHKDGRLKVIAIKDGTVAAETRVPSPAWDGLAIANRRLYLSTQAGEVVCVGE